MIPNTAKCGGQGVTTLLMVHVVDRGNLQLNKENVDRFWIWTKVTHA